MALTQITYSDKSNYQSSSLANEYKVSASDLNEIKSVVNGACTQIDNSTTYSTTETVIGTWLGKPLYRKVFNIGNLPNAGASTYTTGLTNVICQNIWGRAIHTNNTMIPIPYVGSSIDFCVHCNFTSDNKIAIGTNNNDRSQFVGVIVLEYTKTTD